MNARRRCERNPTFFAMFALLVGVSGRSAGAAKLARASAAKSSGRAELATGAWAMSDAYINRTATKSCGEPVQAWCVYRLDTDGHAALRPKPMLPERGRGAVHTRAEAQYDVHDGVA